MSNAFGFVLDDTSVRRAAVEGVSQNVIAAIYLLHERSVGEVAAKLRPDELEHVIRLVGRCCYPAGTLDALKSKRVASPTHVVGSTPPSAGAKDKSAHPALQASTYAARREATYHTAARAAKCSTEAERLYASRTISSSVWRPAFGRRVCDGRC